MNIAFIPIDNRPVCYTLPEQVCAINSSINLFMPERKYLGSLTKYADVDKIFEWLEKIPQVDAIVTVSYTHLKSLEFAVRNPHILQTKIFRRFDRQNRICHYLYFCLLYTSRCV